MQATDTATLTVIASRPGVSDDSRFEVLSDNRHAAAAKAVLAHAEEFDLDSDVGHFDATVYIGSLLADILALAENLPETNASEVVERAVYYLGEAEKTAPIAQGLRKHWKFPGTV